MLAVYRLNITTQKILDIVLLVVYQTMTVGKVMVKIAWEQVSLLMVTHTLQTYMLFKTVKVKLQDLKM